jgi:hypothetical protein
MCLSRACLAKTIDRRFLIDRIVYKRAQKRPFSHLHARELVLLDLELRALQRARSRNPNEPRLAPLVQHHYPATVHTELSHHRAGGEPLRRNATNSQRFVSQRYRSSCVRTVSSEQQHRVWRCFLTKRGDQFSDGLDTDCTVVDYCSSFGRFSVQIPAS